MRFEKILGLVALSSAANAYEALRDYLGKDGFQFGVAANTNYFGQSDYVNAMKNFSMMVAENGCKLSGIQQQKGVYNFSDCDNHLKKAEENGMKFRGHCLIWHSYQPSWFENADANTLKNAIVDHITNVLQHYEGKIEAWDVVNEAIDDSSNGNGWTMRNSFLYQKVPNFVDLAFQTARKVSPNTKLFYNDYNTEGVWGKSDSVYYFVQDLVKRGIPIDGVGIQYHAKVQYQPTLDRITNIIKRYCDLGLEVHITELDVSCEDKCYGDSSADQTVVFTNALKACLANSCCKNFLVWGVSDTQSWLGADKKGLLFDGSYQPKPQYNALLSLLKSELGPTQEGGSSSDECWATKLGYSCCPAGTGSVYTDADGKWGVYNNEWCGIVASSSGKCFSEALGYSCCTSGTEVIYTDADGKWGVNNNEWCGIN